jgi:hypothetical protein
VIAPLSAASHRLLFGGYFIDKDDVFSRIVPLTTVLAVQKEKYELTAYGMVGQFVFFFSG